MATPSSAPAWRIPMDRGAWGYSPWGWKESDTTEQLSTPTLQQVILRSSASTLVDKRESFLTRLSSWATVPTSSTWLICLPGLCLKPSELWLCLIAVARTSNGDSMVAQMVKHLPAMQETWVQSLGWEDPLEKEMATHSSTLAWKIPQMEEPGRLQSMRSQRVGHDWATSLTHSLTQDFQCYVE